MALSSHRPSVAVGVGLIALFSAGLFAQTNSPSAFEVASIKVSDPTKGPAGVLTYPGGRVRMGHLSLSSMVAAALDVDGYQVSFGPAWIGDENYDVDARVPANSESSHANPPNLAASMNAEQRGMVLTLLGARFQLKFHREFRQGSVYVLTKGNKRLRLDDAKLKNDVSWFGSPHQGMLVGDGIAAQNLSMPALATWLSYYMRRPVLDRTEIKGSFDFRYDYVSGESKPDLISSIITSIEEIGLKLTSGKGPVETIVIDHAEKPTEN